MKKSIYMVGECDYCGEENQILRPTPFMADVPAKMCKYCWEETRKEYAACNGEYIGKFDECEGYSEAKENVITDEGLKEILESVAECSDQENPIERIALKRIEELEKENEALKSNNENIHLSDHKRVCEIMRLQALNRELKQIIKDLVFAYQNKDTECPHDFEIEALKKAGKVSG